MVGRSITGNYLAYGIYFYACHCDDEAKFLADNPLVLRSQTLVCNLLDRLIELVRRNPNSIFDRYYVKRVPSPTRKLIKRLTSSLDEYLNIYIAHSTNKAWRKNVAEEKSFFSIQYFPSA